MWCTSPPRPASDAAARTCDYCSGKRHSVTASTPRSRACCATPALAAAPPPDRGLTNSTGRLGRETGRHPYCIGSTWLWLIAGIQGGSDGWVPAATAAGPYLRPGSESTHRSGVTLSRLRVLEVPLFGRHAIPGGRSGSFRLLPDLNTSQSTGPHCVGSSTRDHMRNG